MQLALFAFRLGRRRWEARRRSRGDGLAASVARGRAGVWQRGAGRVRGDGLAASVARGGGLTAGRGAGPWRGGELSHLAFVKFTWHLPLLIIKQLAPKKVQVSPIWFHLEPQCALEWPRMAITVPGEFHEASSRGRLIDRAQRTPLDNTPGHIRLRDGIDLSPSSAANPSRHR